MKASLDLSFCNQVKLFPKPPFHFDSSLHKPDHFPTSDNAWEPGTRWQSMRWQGEFLGLKFVNQGTVDDPCIDLSIHSLRELSRGCLAGLEREICYRYNLELDLNPFYQAFRSTPQLQPLLARWRGMRPLNVNSLYEYLIIAIVLQNATVRRSVQMTQALFEAYGTPLRYDGREFFSYWLPEDLADVTEAELRSLKVGYRAKSIFRVTQAFIRGEIDEFALRNLPREEQRQALLGLYGIGPASVGYLLTDVYHHLDEMEHISPWEQKIYSKLFFDADLENPRPVEDLIAFFDEHFAGYRGLAVQYVWEDLFWRRKNEPVEWLEKLIRL